MNELQDTLEEIMKIFKFQEDMLDILENEQYRSLLAQKENQKLIETNRKLLAENEKAQNIFREAKTKADCINGAMAAWPICAVILKCRIQKSGLFDSLK